MDEGSTATGQHEAAVDPLVGRVIHERFRILSRIARGGMGAVYRAEQSPLGRLVAIKVLSPRHEEEKDPEFRRRFFLEAASVAKLSHPNTVTVFDYGQNDNLFFIAMELIEGPTLKQALRAEGPFPPERALHIAKQICRSLREAHRLGIVHRDMKPGNVMLVSQGDERDFVKVLDFGLVKEIDPAEDEEDLTQQGVFMGSPKYMSPEQVKGDRVDGRSDIYSVGVLLYEMLTGKPPFIRDKHVHILMDHVQTPVPPLTPPEGAPPFPPELEHVVMKALSKQREDRFKDMEQFLYALKALSGDPMSSGAASLSVSVDLGHGTPVSGVHSLPIEAPNTSEHPSFTPSGSGAVPISMSAPLHDEPKRSFLPFVLVAVVVLLALTGVGYWALSDSPRGVDRAETSAPPEPAAEGADTRVAASDQARVEADEEVVAAPEPEPRVVRASITSRPSRARVTLGDETLGTTPLDVELTDERAEPGTELTFTFARSGFEDEEVEVTVGEDEALEVEARMRRSPRPTGNARPSGGGSGGSPTVVPSGYRDSPY